MNLSPGLIVVSLKNAVALLKIIKESSGLIKHLMTLLTNFPIRLSNLIVTVKLQTVHLQSLFQREEMPLLDRMKMMSQLYHSMLQMREHPLTFHLLNLMMLQLLLMLLLLLIPTPPMNLIPSIYTKASKLGNANLAVSVELTNSPVPLDPSRFQFAPPNSPVRNLRANNAIIFGMRLVILC